jgi:hypothetical protein
MAELFQMTREETLEQLCIPEVDESIEEDPEVIATLTKDRVLDYIFNLKSLLSHYQQYSTQVKLPKVISLLKFQQKNTMKFLAFYKDLTQSSDPDEVIKRHQIASCDLKLDKINEII